LVYHVRNTKVSIQSAVLVESIKDNCKKAGMNISQDNINKLFNIMVSTAADYVYHNPESRIDFPHFSIIRCRSKVNLIQIDIKRDKEVDNAEELLYFYLNEGLERREIKKIIDEFVDTLVDYSSEKEDENSEIIKKIKSNKKSKKGQ